MLTSTSRAGHLDNVTDISFEQYYVGRSTIAGRNLIQSYKNPFTVTALSLSKSMGTRDSRIKLSLYCLAGKEGIRTS